MATGKRGATVQVGAPAAAGDEPAVSSIVDMSPEAVQDREETAAAQAGGSTPGTMQTGESVEEATRPNRLDEICGGGVNILSLTQCCSDPIDAFDRTLERYKTTVEQQARSVGVSLDEYVDQFKRDFLTRYEAKSQRVVAWLHRK